MCGIVGILYPSSLRAVNRDLLAAMNDAQSHRGPDDAGLFVAPGIGLGHRRLSIIDVAGGHQPMFNEDDSIAVVFNGEIYNFRELVEILEARGHRFRTRCDTEVIVHAWEEWGEASVERFRGMFAFGLWDEKRQTLFLARDRLGIKPLYYATLPDGTLVFSSELKGLLVHPDVGRTIDPQAVEDYFALGYVPDPKTIYREAAKLPPAHRMVVQRGAGPARPDRFWNVSFREKHPQDERSIAGEIVERLREAVRIRLIAEVPLGAFLSGGVDSSAVVALMAQIKEDPVEACSISFDDPRFDEIGYAAQVAERYGVNHHVRAVNPSDFALIDRLIDAYDEPFADSSALPTYQVCALGREFVTVALSGDGGDEVFGGYKRYRWHLDEQRLRRWLPQRIRQPLFGALGAAFPPLYGAPRIFRGKASLLAMARDTADGYAHLISILPIDQRQALYSADMRSKLGGYDARELIRQTMRNAPADDDLDRLQYTDMMTYLPGDILAKVDRASMAHALEVRVPLLDHPFVEWAAGIAPAMKLRNGEGKAILKHAVEPLLPRDLLHRTKMGFAVPVAEWFRGPLRRRLEEALDSLALRGCGMIDPTAARHLLARHLSRQVDYSAGLWALLMFEGFLRAVHKRPTWQPQSAAAVPPARTVRSTRGS